MLDFEGMRNCGENRFGILFDVALLFLMSALLIVIAGRLYPRVAR